MSSNGSWGFSAKRVVSWPVWGSGSTWPASLATMPVFGVFDREVDGEQGAEGVVEGLGEVDGAVQRLEDWVAGFGVAGDLRVRRRAGRAAAW